MREVIMLPTIVTNFLPPGRICCRSVPYRNCGAATAALTEGWQLNGIIAMHSGEAFTPLLSQDYTNTDSGAPRPDLIADPDNRSNAVNEGCPANKQTIQCWYNPAAFALPSLAPGQSFAREYGNARRGSLRGPAIYNVDASLFKNRAPENAIPPRGFQSLQHAGIRSAIRGCGSSWLAWHPKPFRFHHQHGARIARTAVCFEAVLLIEDAVISTKGEM